MTRSLLLLFLICCCRYADGQAPFVVKEGLPYTARNLPVTPLWFADSRLAFSFDGSGVGQLDYYSPIPNQNLATVFLRQLWDGFRYYLIKDGKRYKPEFSNTTTWPFGMESDWKMGSAIIRQKVLAVDECLAVQITTPADLPSGMLFSLEFYEAFGLSRGSDEDLRYTNGQFTRKWSSWSFDSTSNTLTGGFTSLPGPSAQKRGVAPFDTWCTWGATFPLRHVPRGINPKHILLSPELSGGKTYTFVLSFSNGKEAAAERNRQLLANWDDRVARQFRRYRDVLARSPVLESPYPMLNDFIRMAPMYHESLKIVETPGAIRAKTTNYWIWAWDGMTCNDAAVYWGDTAHIRNMLSFYEKNADSVKGIGHALEFDNSSSNPGPLPEQGMFITLLQLYYQHTGDAGTVKQRYGFARKLFLRLMKDEVRNTGLCKG